ncbi:MAG: DUF58 domain-containing protein [Actinomycetota bacterium]|nr:DUF58 domain-containing protein [Actinomycetota bacterium]
MPTARGWAAFGSGLVLWGAARLMGSPDLHMVAVGVFILPLFAALFVHWNRLRLDVHRHVSPSRAFPDAPVTVTLTVRNHGPGTVPFLLLEDALPPELARPARVVVGGVPARNEQDVSYRIGPRQRGQYSLGPTSMWITDPFGLARIRIESAAEGRLVVYPRVEDVTASEMAVRGTGRGDSKARELHRSAAEFYTMREYVMGDDLRRIHWPSVARTQQLMIRQDEATRRSAATVLLDNRAVTLGPVGSPGFERAVSIVASIGRSLAAAGFALHFATIDSPSEPVSEERLLEILAAVGHSRQRELAGALAALKGRSVADSSLLVVGAPPIAAEIEALIRAGTRFGGKTAVLVDPADRLELRPEAAAEMEARTHAARARLQQARWLVCAVRMGERLAEAWTKDGKTARRATVASFS